MEFKDLATSTPVTDIEAVSEIFEGELILIYKIPLDVNSSLVGGTLTIEFGDDAPVITTRGTRIFVTDLVNVLPSQKRITLVKKQKKLKLDAAAFSAFSPKTLHNIVNNPVTKGVIGAVIIVGIIGNISTIMNVGCFNPGVGFIKFFQIIEVFGRFLFIPVVFNQQLHDVLYGINELGEFVNFESDILVKTQQSLLKGQFRYWFKLTIYNEWKNIFQAMPLSIVILLLILAVRAALLIYNKIRNASHKP